MRRVRHERTEPFVERGNLSPEHGCPFTRQDVHRKAPALARSADDLRYRHGDVFEAHLREVFVADARAQRLDDDPGCVHVDEKRGETAVSRSPLARAGQEDATFGEVSERGPDLLPVDDVDRKSTRLN